MITSDLKVILIDLQSLKLTQKINLFLKVN
jgi:hypothetical protein